MRKWGGHPGILPQEQSGRESAVDFWRRELQRRKAEQQQRNPAPRRGTRGAKVAFLPVHEREDVAAPPMPGRIEIELAGGRRVHVAAPVDRQALADVLAVLEVHPC